MIGFFRHMKNYLLLVTKSSFTLCENGRTINVCIMTVSYRFLFKSNLKGVIYSFLIKTPLDCTYSILHETDYGFSLQEPYD